MKIVKNLPPPAKFQPVELLITLESQAELDALKNVAVNGFAVSLFLAHGCPPLALRDDSKELTREQLAAAGEIETCLAGVHMTLGEA